MKIVWARHGVSASECPKSYITAESLGWVEQFAIRRILGATLSDLAQTPARTVDAFSVLEQELSNERSNGRTD